MKIKSFAKINLMLKVISKENNGYHNLQMINAKIDLHDIISIKQANIEKNIISFKNIDTKNKKFDMIENLLNDFFKKYKIDKKYKIKIYKKIPIGAGLGGASSNAADIIKYIIKDNNITISNNELIEFTKKYGADIPYCLEDIPCLVEGIGDKITKLEGVKKKYVLVVNPKIFVSTKEVFEKNKAYSNPITKFDLPLSQYYTNDLEQTTFSLYNKIQGLKEQIKLLSTEYVGMSGTGSTIIALFEDKKKMKRVIKQIDNKNLIIKSKIK